MLADLISLTLFPSVSCLFLSFLSRNTGATLGDRYPCGISESAELGSKAKGHGQKKGDALRKEQRGKDRWQIAVLTREIESSGKGL
jgi:hypothetical protein